SKSVEQDGKVKKLVASNRWRKLMTLQRKIAREKNRALIGREREVLVEGPSEEHDLVMMGRHRGQAPEIDGQVYLSGDVLPGQMRRVTVTQASDYARVGDVIAESDSAPVTKKKRVSLKVLGATPPRAHQ